jgi:HEAT repeat protein
LKDERPTVRREVLIALGRVGPDAAHAVPVITAYLSNDDPAVRHSAAYALGRIGPSAAEAAGALRQGMQSDDQLMRAVSSWSLARIEPMNEAARDQAISLLTVAIKHKNPRVQLAALRALIDLEPQPAVLVPALGQVFAEDNGELINEALGALASFGEAATPALIEALKRPETRGRAAGLIARVGPQASAATGALVAALCDKDAEVRREVLFALASMGDKAVPAQAAIASALQDPEVRVRTIATYALGRIGPPAKTALPQLRAARSDG